MIIGSVVGAAAGVLVAIPLILLKKGGPATKAISKTSLLGQKAALKLIGKSALVGAGCGSAIGGITAGIKTRNHNRAVADQQVEQLGEDGAHQAPAQTDAANFEQRRGEIAGMCRALFDAMFDEIEAICPISQEVIIMPTIIPQGGAHQCTRAIFNFTHIYQWVIDNETCPLCRRRVTVEDLRFCDQTFVRINRAVKGALAQLKETIDRADRSHLRQALNNPDLQITEETADRIRAGTITPLECARIARYLRPGIAKYNENIMNIYLAQLRELEELRDAGDLTPVGFFAESRRIADWCETYQFPTE